MECVAVSVCDVAVVLDDILARWHRWQSAHVGRGWNRRALVVGEYLTSRQYDAGFACDEPAEALKPSRAASQLWCPKGIML